MKTTTDKTGRLQTLGGPTASIEVARAALDKTIVAMYLDHDEALHVEFEDRSKMKLCDVGQTCCELRYMRTDDDLGDYVGAVLIDIEIRRAPDVEDEDGTHEVQFLVVKTSKGDATMSSHNRHNGYYSGFEIVAVEE